MELESTFIDGVYLLKRQPQGDDRGFFERLFCKTALANIFTQQSVCQINHSHTKESGTVRGLHFQYPPYAEKKIIYCIRGSVFDVVVDLRKGSPTFLSYYAHVLSDENYCSMLVPEGVAHGFQTLTSDCEMLYLHTAEYRKQSEGIINALDPSINVKWPLKITNRSKKDSNQKMLTKRFKGITNY